MVSGRVWHVHGFEKFLLRIQLLGQLRCLVHHGGGHVIVLLRGLLEGELLDEALVQHGAVLLHFLPEAHVFFFEVLASLAEMLANLKRLVLLYGEVSHFLGLLRVFS